MNLVKEKQGGLVPPGLKRWPFKLIKHFTDTTRVLPSPAGSAGCCPLNFLKFDCLVNSQRELFCDADAESLSLSDIWLH